MSEMIVKLNTDRVKIKGCEYVQDLIRCKDCRWYKCEECFFSTAEINPDDFCSYAERKAR